MTKKIAIISDHASPLAVLGGVDNGGQNVYVAQIAKQLALNGFQVDVFTRKDAKHLQVVQNWQYGIRVIHVPAGPEEFVRKEDLLPYIPEFSRFVRQFMRREVLPYDLVHANFWMSGIVAMDLKRFLNIPFVMTFHALGRVRKIYQGENDGFPAERGEIEDRIVSAADCIIAECPQDRQDLIQFYRADPRKIQIIPCGFDPEEMCPVAKPAARKKLKLPVNSRIILQLGRMVPRKGVDNVIQSLAILREQHHVKARLLVVGGDTDQVDVICTPEIGRLKTIAEETGVSDQVWFLGRKARNLLKYYYSAADLFVSTPWYEPFGITPVEAMACGTPVIGSRVGGIQFSVKDNETGFLVPPKDPVALAERMNLLFRDKDLLVNMGKSSIKRANNYFTWEQVARSLMELYAKVIRDAEPELDEQTQKLAVIDEGFKKAMATFNRSRQSLGPAILGSAQVMVSALQQGNKILVCGNGGSAADAQHFAAELVGKFVKPFRPGLPVLALSADSAIVTAWANDVGFEKIYSRQVEAYGQPGDVILAISTTGQSKNLLAAFEAARQRQMFCVSLLGGNGGELFSLSTVAMLVPEENKQRVQEVQIFILHALCELIEEQFSPNLVFDVETVKENEGWDVKPKETIKLPYSQNI